MDIQPRNERIDNEIQDYLSKERNDLTAEDLGGSAPSGKKKLIAALAAVILIVLAFAYASYQKGHSSFTMEKVKVTMDMDDKVASGEESSLTITCENSNSVGMRSARLMITFPENFLFKSSDQTIQESGSAHYWDVGTIGAKGSAKIRIYGKVTGRMDEERTFKAILSYEPSNFSSEFRSEASKTVRIGSVPVELALDYPESALDSTDTELTFRYKNKSSRSFEKARLEIDIPAAFIITSSEPALAKVNGGGNTYAYEDTSAPFGKDAEKTVKVTGKFQSQNAEEAVKARVYLMEENKEMVEYAEETKSVKMSKTDILLTQTVNGQAAYTAGKNEELAYRITFKNQSGKDLRGLVLHSTLSGNFDFNSVKAEKGTAKSGEIIWSATGVPELGQLSDGAEASVVFRIKTLDRMDIKSDTDKNFILKNEAAIGTVSSTASSGTEEKVLARNENDTKLRSFLYLDTRGYYNDDGRIENSGPLPPHVGSRTTYTIHWSLRNFFNDSENIRVWSVLPRGVTWTGRYIDAKGHVQSAGTASTSFMTPDGEKITEEKIFFDDAKKAVVWEIPLMKANEGVLTSAKEIIFQVLLTPEKDELGSAAPLLGAATVSGFDTFSQSQTTNAGTALTTDLTATDFSISDSEAIVKKELVDPSQ